MQREPEGTKLQKRSLKIKDNSLSLFLKKGSKIKSRQELKKTFVRNGIFYIFKVKKLLNKKTIYLPKCFGSITKHEHVNIDDISDLKKYYNLINSKKVDAIFGSRFISGSKVINYPKQKYLLNRIFNFIVSIIFFNRYNDFTNAFKIYKKKTLINLLPFVSEHFNIFLELPLKIIIRKFKYKIVPIKWKNRKNENGSLEPNDVTSVADFQKMGQKGYCTSHLGFGDNDDCRGWLVGEENKGLYYMFLMMNAARIAVGRGASAIATAAYNASLNYANERPQGRKLSSDGKKNPDEKPSLIIEHPDVRRMLLFQKSMLI